MIIDGHAHACGRFLNGDNLVKALDNAGVDKVVLVPGELGSKQTYTLPKFAEHFPTRDLLVLTNAVIKSMITITGKVADVPEGNRRVYEMSKTYPERIIQFYWALLGKTNTIQEMKIHFTEWAFKGIKLHQCWDAFHINSEIFSQVVRFAADKDLPIFIHVSNYREVKLLINVIKRNPETTFIIGHLFGLKFYIQSKHKFENVYFEISPYHLISSSRIMKAIEHFGAERIILGSDTPYGQDTLRLNLERVKTLPISKSEQEMILGKNIKLVLKL